MIFNAYIIKNKNKSGGDTKKKYMYRDNTVSLGTGRCTYVFNYSSLKRFC